MSTHSQAAAEGSSGDGLVSILRRRWWIVALCAVLFPLAAYTVASQREKVYVAEAVVLLNQTNLANLLTDTPDPSLRVDRDRQAKTQVEIAQIPTISKRTLKKLKLSEPTPDELQDAVTVSAEPGTDLLRISVRDSDPERARSLAREYAQQYTSMRARVDTRALAETLSGVRRRLEGDNLGSELRDSLRSKEARLSTLITLQTRDSLVIREPTAAKKVEPTPSRDAALALLLGLIFGCTLALIVDARDRRIRDAGSIAAAWDVPLIGRVPPVGSAASNRIAMLHDPRGPEADAYRFAVSGLDPESAAAARTILVVSASDIEGRSRAIANLAVAFARSGEHVLALDLDFEGGRLSRLFGAEEGPGASEVAVGSVPWENAARQVAIAPAHATNGDGPSVAGLSEGTLTLLPTGAVPASTPDFVASHSVTELIERVEATFDRILIDAPGLLGASDALLLSHSADALLAVASVRQLNRDVVAECDRILARVPAPVIGMISTDDATPAKLLRRPSRAERRTSVGTPEYSSAP